MRNPLLTALCLTSMLAGCAGGGTRPDWIDGNSKQYGNDRYLVGRGQAGNQEDAKNRARADLAKIFQVAVSAESEDVQAYRNVTDSKGAVSQNQASVRRALTTRTEQIVRGVQIADLWQDPATKTQYALAVLPRAQAAASLRQQIEALDDATRSYIEQARSAHDLFAQIGAAGEALALQAERQGYQKSLSVVDRSGRGIEPQWSSAKLAADLDALLKRVRVSPQVTKSTLDGLDNALAGGLAAAGFAVQDGDKANYTLNGALDLDDLGRQEGWYWMKGTLEVKLADRATGRVVGTRRWDIKAAGREPALARRRAMDEVAKILNSELRKTVIGFGVTRP